MMNENAKTPGGLFRNNFSGKNLREKSTIQTSNFVIKDTPEIQTYSLQEVLNKVILGDALKVLKKLPKESVDMIFMDPPYFLQLPNKKLKRWTVKTEVNAVDDDWDKFESFEEYDNFIKNILTELKRVMKPNATIWVIATYHSIFRIGKIMQDLGFWILNDVHWVKTNPMPNWLGVRFTNATETLIWAVKDKKAKKYTFNKALAKEFGIGKVGANVWVLPICNGKERLKDENSKKLHSTQKPIELLKRVILTTTKEGDVILDPVAGVGTTGYVAKALNRNFIMIEIIPKYVEGIKKRFQKPLKISLNGFSKNQKKIQEYLNLKVKE
ncbi:DNA-methyltransferase [Thermosipho atlanticus]|uniref:Methyltransferase n=1 Tax=Thermosipho atlanticus DSM 15807 TaxID=1123380 RepID=A0A1M5TUA2_9BACT|nr:site-specific DNA-methyltransferase [Thermosipho atlanticus]SHH54352.1 site-specific DNA-methyltransferase (adenine-specific) [Thermosipho atlanticus DSM 15807]